MKWMKLFAVVAGVIGSNLRVRGGRRRGTRTKGEQKGSIGGTRIPSGKCWTESRYRKGLFSCERTMAGERGAVKGKELKAGKYHFIFAPKVLDKGTGELEGEVAV